MTSAFFGLNTALRALVASQTQLHTAAHNTANASTPGYSRQRVTLVAAPPYTYPTLTRTGQAGQIGTGVTVATIARVRDAFLDLQRREQQGYAAGWEARHDQLSRVETVFPEPSDSALGAAMARFWSSWQQLAADPSSVSVRTVVVQNGSQLAAGFVRAAGQLDRIREGIDREVTALTDEVNDLAGRIAALNTQIQRVVVTGDHANDLEDQRDLLLDRLAQLVPVTLSPEGDGQVTVLVGGTDLVTGPDTRAVTLERNGSGQLVPIWGDGRPLITGEGRIGSLIATRDGELALYRTRLDELATGIADAVNAGHSGGVDATGAAGGDFFAYDPADPAGTLRVHADVLADSRRVVAAAAAGKPGDGSVAGAIADLRAGKLFSGGTQTAADRYAELVGKLGSDVRHASEMTDNHRLIVDHLEERLGAASGVSLDEEAADVIRFQQAYRAAARLIDVYDQMLDEIISLGR